MLLREVRPIPSKVLVDELGQSLQSLDGLRNATQHLAPLLCWLSEQLFNVCLSERSRNITKSDSVLSSHHTDSDGRFAFAPAITSYTITPLPFSLLHL